MIYPTRAIEQDQTHAYRSLLQSEQFHRVYLDELGPIESLPLPVALTVLTTLEAEAEMEAQALALAARTQASALSPGEQRAIMEMLASILSYKFTHLTRREVEAMLGITFKETRLYQDLREEILAELQREVLQETQAAQQAARDQWVQVVSDLLNQRFGKRSVPWKAGLAKLDLQLLMDLVKELLSLDSPRAVLEWLVVDQGEARVREGVLSQFVAGILGPQPEAIAQRLAGLTVEEGMGLVDCLAAATSLTQVRQALREWLQGLA